MTMYLVLFAALALAVVVIGLVAVKPREYRALRWSATAMAIALVPALAFAGSLILGQPKPQDFEFLRDQEEAVILGHRMVENEAIYLYLYLPGETPPLSISLPWDKETAKKLQEAMEGDEGRGVRMKLPFDNSIAPDTQFEVIPVPRMQPKPKPSNPPDAFGV